MGETGEEEEDGTKTETDVLCPLDLQYIYPLKYVKLTNGNRWLKSWQYPDLQRKLNFSHFLHT